MAATIPVDLCGQTYPAAPAGPAVIAPFRPSDAALAWGLDFHYPRGVLPLSHELVSLVTAASRASADALPAATGRGLESRVIGPHVYTAGIPVLDAGARAERAAAAASRVAAYPEEFARLWRRHCRDLDAQYATLLAVDLDASTATIRTAFDLAFQHFAQAWQVHFDVMYPMLAVLDAFRTMCRAIGIDDSKSADLIASGDNAIQQTDIAMGCLAAQALEAGLEPVLNRASGLEQALRRAPQASEWMLSFDEFLRHHGQRADSIVDVGAVSWACDPEQPLGLIRDLVRNRASAPNHERVSRLDSERAQRCRAVADSLGGHDRNVFLRGLARAVGANFAWWNEDHNARIDLRAHLPVGRLAGELAVRHGLGRTDATLLFAEEVRTLDAREDLTDLVRARRAYQLAWRARRQELPRGFGQPGPVNDPVLAEIIGVRRSGADKLGAPLLGLGVSTGAARGRARIVTSPEDLHRLDAGDVLVCEGTSPSWTVVFPRLAACVCDTGGMLTHAAIICRELGIPCVAAVGVATRVVQDGDLVEVDGQRGTVTILERRQ